MKKSLKKVLAFTLILAMFVPFFSVCSYSANIKANTSTDIVFFFGKEKTYSFKAEKDGIYRIKSSAPKKFIGTIFELFNFKRSDPAVVIEYSKIDKTLFDKTITDKCTYSKGKSEYTSNFDAYIYLNKGETYSFKFRNDQKGGFLGAFSVDIAYQGEYAFIEFTPPTKKSYKTSDSGISYNEAEQVYSVEALNLSGLNATVYFDDDSYITFNANEFISNSDGYFIPRTFEIGTNTVYFFLFDEYSEIDMTLKK